MSWHRIYTIISRQSSWDLPLGPLRLYKAAAFYCGIIRRLALVLDGSVFSRTSFHWVLDWFWLLLSLLLDFFDCFFVADCCCSFSVVSTTCLTSVSWILLDASSSTDCCAVSTSLLVGRCCLKRGRRLRRRSCRCCIFVWELPPIIRLRLKMMLCLCWHHCRYFANTLLRRRSVLLVVLYWYIKEHKLLAVLGLVTCYWLVLLFP